jgi:hypothetical protein
MGMIEGIKRALRFSAAFILAVVTSLSFVPTLKVSALSQPTIFFSRNVMVGNQNTGNQLWAMNPDGTNMRPITGVDNSFMPALSPDGTRLVYMKSNVGLMMLNLATNTTSVLLANNPSQPYYPAWSPDGSQITFSLNGGVYRMPASGGAPTLVVSSASSSDWSPDGQWISYNSSGNSGASQAYIVHPDGSEPTQLTFDFSYHGRPFWSPDGSQLMFECSQAYTLCFYDMASHQQTSVPMVPVGGHAKDPSWTNIPGKIAFSGYIPGNGTYRIYTANTDGSDLTMLTNTGPDSGYWDDSYTEYGVVQDTFTDTEAPVLGAATWSVNPKAVNQTTSISLPVTDSSSGVSSGEYFIGDSDPGQGNGADMNWDGTNLSVGFGTDFMPGVYKINIRAVDGAGNWSAPVTEYLVVYDPATTLGVIGKSRDMVPNQAAGDVLPGLNGTDKANYGFTVDYNNGVLDLHNDFQFSYNTGSQCNSPHPNNCHSFEVNATNFDWQIIDQTNNSRGRFQGTATVQADGVVTTNPFTVEAIDGNRLAPEDQDHFVLKIYEPGASPSVGAPMYQVSGYLPKSGAVTIR